MLVQIKGTNDRVMFPDDMDREQIKQVLQRKYYQQKPQEQRVNEMLTPQENKAEVYNPSLAERTGQTIADYLVDNGIISDRYGAQQIGANLSTALGFVPGIGDAQAGDEFGTALREGDTVGALASGAAAIPIIGEAASKGIKGARNLYKAHNITEGGLRAADELGGLSVPSLAVTSKDSPMEGFGEISLVGEKGSFAKDPTFASDVYSPRFPRTKTDLDRKALDDEIQRISSEVDERIEPGITGRLNAESLSEDITRLNESRANKQAYLQSIGKGVDPEDYITKPEPYKMPDWYTNLGMDENTVFTLKDMDSPEFIEKATEFADKMNPERDIPDWWSNGELTDKAKRDILKDFRQVRVSMLEQEPKFDSFKMRTEIDDRVKQNKDGFEKYLDDQKAKISKGKYFDVWNPDTATSKKLQYNLGNAVKLMKGNIRGGENFSYGAGNIRSQVTPELKSIDQIMDNRGKIVPADQMTLVKEEIDSELENLYDSLSGNWAWGETPDYSTFMDGVSNAAKGDLSDFKNLSPEQQQELTGFFERIAEAPTEYFEIKPQRAVDINEFYGAAVPVGTPQNVVDGLRSKGLEVEFYGEEGRKEALERLDKKSGGNIFFSAGGAAVLYGGTRNDDDKDNTKKDAL